MRFLLVFLCLLVTPASAQTFNGLNAGSVAPVVSSGGGCAEATAVLARMTGANTNAVTNFVCGLAHTDGLITGNMGSTGCGAPFDAIYLHATNSHTNGDINICGTAFTITEHGTPTFTANNGFTGNSSTMFLDTGYVQTTTSGGSVCGNGAAACNIASGSISFGTYNGSNRTTSQFWISIGTDDSGVNNSNSSIVDYATGPGFGSIVASLSGSTACTFAATNAHGLVTIDQAAAGAGTVRKYEGGAAITASGCSSFIGFSGFSFFILGRNDSGGGIALPSSDLIQASFLGGHLTNSQWDAFSSRLNQYMIDVGATYHY